MTMPLGSQMPEADSTARTGVKLEMGSKGEIKPSVHVYVGTTDEEVNKALEQAMRAFNQLVATYASRGV